MEGNKKLVEISLVTVMMFFISFIFFFNDIINYFIVFVTITIVLFSYLCYLVFSKKDEESLYKRKLKNILKTFDSVLVYSDNQYQLDEKNIIFVKKFNDLAVAQEELNKPIVYVSEEKSSVFLLKEDNELLVYVMKVNDDVESAFENSLKNYLNETNRMDDEISENVLEELEKTTIIQLKNNKVYKVSPLKNK